MTEYRTADLASWISERATRGPVHIAARDDAGWIDRNYLTRDIDSLSLELAAGPEERYHLSVDEMGDGLQLERRVRLAFTVVGVNEDQQLQRENVEILLEFPRLDVEAMPDFGGETVTLPTAMLQYVDSDREEHANYRSVTANRVAGLETEKKQLVRFLETGNRQWGLSEPTGIILEGPPGTGKTELVMEVCQEKYGALPVTISGPEVLSKWVGESERLLREKFEETLETTHRILYIDELDAIARRRAESSQDYIAQLVSQLLVLLDGVEAKDEDPDERPLRVLASTNIAQVIDPALLRPGRLGNRPIQFGRPSEWERIAIVHHYLENIHASSGGRLGETLRRGVTTPDGISVIRQLAREMEGFTGADIEDLIQESVSRLRMENQEELSRDFLEEVLKSGFSSSDKYRTREFTPDDLTGLDSGSVATDQQVIELVPEEANTEHAEQLAKRYFSSFAKTAPTDRRYVFRTVSPQHLLAADSEQTREQTAAAFQHIESERVCLYLTDMEVLARARTHSSLVQTVIEVVNEQLIQWHEENVLLVEAGEETESLFCFE